MPAGLLGVEQVLSQNPRAARPVSPVLTTGQGESRRPAQRLWFVTSPVTSHHHWTSAGRGGNRDDN